jgi:Core-2/I-Branching enzyme
MVMSSTTKHDHHKKFHVLYRLRYYGILLLPLVSIQLMIYSKQSTLFFYEWNEWNYHQKRILGVEQPEIKELEQQHANRLVTEYNHTNLSSIAFMFMMAKNQPMHQDIWERWFRSTNNSNKYSIFVHHGQKAKHRNPLRSNWMKKKITNDQWINNNRNSSSHTMIQLDHTENMTVPIPLNPFFCPRVIPSVSTGHFCCLYKGMMQLLQAAYDGDPYAEKFIFLSPTTIPLMLFNELYDQLITNNLHPLQSRFCFMGKPHLQWKHMANILNINLHHTARKAEMWSILSREHVRLLLENRPRMDHWYKTFQNERSKVWNQRIPIGAPDEIFFPTMLTMLQQQTTNRNTTNMTTGNFFEEDCLDIYKSSETNKSCCLTKVFWTNKAKPINVTDEKGVDSIRLSDTCHKYKPCNLHGPLYEEGLRRLQSLGYHFLRKVPRNKKNHQVVVKTLSNETISLYDALNFLHQRQSMTTSTTISEKGTSSSFNSDMKSLSVRNLLLGRLGQADNDGNERQHHEDDNFQCRVQPVLDVEPCWCLGRYQNR